MPALPGPLFDDGDLLVFNKPGGLPVLPAGGWLAHTVFGQLQQAWPDARPVHRLGRFTSGLLLCARTPARRAHLSALLRRAPCSSPFACRKTYRALLRPPAAASPLLGLAVGASLALTTPIGRRPHGRLGTLWAAAAPGDAAALPARSTLTLLERRPGAWLVEVAIATGRPHQIRIHCAAAGAPLLGDPLYGPGGLARDQALPGEGGYHLHGHRLALPAADGSLLQLEAPLPECLGAVSGGS